MSTCDARERICRGSLTPCTRTTIRYISGNLLMAERISERISVSQADVRRFGPHLGHNWLSCGVFLVKARHFGLTLTQTIRPNWQSL